MKTMTWWWTLCLTFLRKVYQGMTIIPKKSIPSAKILLMRLEGIMMTSWTVQSQ